MSNYNIGTAIRTIRKQRRLSQIDVARSAGIAVNSLRLYEANKRKPHFEQIMAIAEALDISVSQLMKEAGAFVYDPDGLDALDSAIRERYSIDPYDNYIVVPIAPSLEQLFRYLSLLNNAGIERATAYVCDLAGNPSYQRDPDTPTSDGIFTELLNCIPNATSGNGGQCIKFAMSPSEVFPQCVPHKEEADDNPE